MSRARQLLHCQSVPVSEATPIPGDIEEIGDTLFLTGPRKLEVDAQRLRAGKIVLGFSERDKNLGQVELTAKQVRALVKFIK